MKPVLPLKQFFYAFLMALAVYALAFFLIEHRRTSHGPWRLEFSSAGEGSPPCLIINEARLNISDLKISFPRQSAPPTNAAIIFDQAQQVPFDVPFGRCILLDLISQPGTVTLELFGHQIELLPRVLTIDRQEHPWQSGTNIEVVP